MKGKLERIILISILLIMATQITLAQPLGATTADLVNSTRYNATIDPAEVDAQAGNVTELFITSLSVTKYWQGFYGNISGQIILADSTGANFYDWNITTPKIIGAVVK